MTNNNASTSRQKLRPDRLLRRTSQRVPNLHATARVARKTLSGLLRELDFGTLSVTDTDGTTTTYGKASPNWPDAQLTITDDRAWSAVLTETSAGLGRGYIEQWWNSPNPTQVVAILVRNLPRMDRARRRWAATGGRLIETVGSWIPQAGRERNREDIAAHYDVGNEFFKVFLDETMTYSSGVFPTPDASLADSSRHKYDRLLSKVEARAGDSVLEIGTGWGGFAIRAASTFGCDVTTTTISSEQHKEAGKRIADAGLSDRISLLEKDWRDLTGQFDRVCSIEMIEAVNYRDYGQYFATIERCLKPEGLVGIQAICMPDQRWLAHSQKRDYIQKFIFPGGMLPSVGSITQAASKTTQLQIIDVEDISAHYAETLRRWRQAFDQNGDQLSRLGLDSRFRRLWQFYLAYCEAGFAERYITVAQFVLAGRAWRPNGLALRSH